MSDSELGKTALSRQIKLASGRGQVDVEELGYALLVDSEFKLCSSYFGRGWEREKPGVTTYGTAAPANEREHQRWN